VNVNENLRGDSSCDEHKADNPLFPWELSELNAFPSVLVNVEVSDGLVTPLSQLIQFHLWSFLTH
jgi:hypothetical protein